MREEAVLKRIERIDARRPPARRSRAILRRGAGREVAPVRRRRGSGRRPGSRRQGHIHGRQCYVRGNLPAERSGKLDDLLRRGPPVRIDDTQAANA
ncbi:MAG TPA: hypothetical protein PKD25_11330 [Rubrivivax sp.]|nr:hypothetical protein [Rubrivivax sp.]